MAWPAGQSVAPIICAVRLPARILLFAQILERSLDAVVVKLLIVAAKLVAASGTAVEKLCHHSHRSMRQTFEPRGAANVDRAIKIKVVDIVIEVADQQARHRLVADAQHFRAGADRGHGLATPPDFVIETEAGNRFATA